MSTRAAIAMRLPDNTIHAIYCHNDGYPGWVGAVLGGFYKTEEQVKALFAATEARVDEIKPNVKGAIK